MKVARAPVSMLLLCLALGWPVVSSAGNDDPEEEVAADSLLVTATRLPRLVRDEPVRVEALPLEEIEENSSVSPGTLATLLEEFAGVQFQPAVAGLGGLGLSLRGLPARFTQVRIDGLPLLAVAPESFGALQTPPVDLAQVELIKGAASSIYGSGPIGGVLNLVSRSPGSESTLVVNGTAQGGQDITGFLTDEKPGSLAAALGFGLHRQIGRDLDGDGWREIPRFERVVVRPRAVWQGDEGRGFLTLGFVHEDRAGGDVADVAAPSLPLQLRTKRFDMGAGLDWRIAPDHSLHSTVAWTSATESQRNGGFASDYRNTLVEGSVWWSVERGSSHRSLAGLGYASRDFQVRDRADLTLRHSTPAAFAQEDFDWTESLGVSFSLRLDRVAEEGWLRSHRASVLWRRGTTGHWSMRASFSSGFSLPTLLLDEVQAQGPAALLKPGFLKSERGTSSSVDLRWADEGLEANLSFFAAGIGHRLAVTRVVGGPTVSNIPGKLRVSGIEILGRWVEGPWHVTASATLLEPRDSDGISSRVGGRVPRHATETSLLRQFPHGRLGIELSYSGPQALWDVPGRSGAAGYGELNLLGAMRLGRMEIFGNLSNLLDRRQSRYGPLRSRQNIAGSLGVIEPWMPVEGRQFNFGARIGL